MRSETKYWYADRVKLLDKFATEVKDGLWHKMPYTTWRTLMHTSAPKLTIERTVGEDDNYEYRIYENACITSTIYEDFGAFLDNNFGSPTLTYKAEAKDMIDNYSNKITADSVNYNDNWTTTPTASNSITKSGNNLYWDSPATPIIIKTPCDEDDVRRICEDIISNINKKKENKKMDTSNLFNFDFGPASSNQFRMSPYGLAVRTQANGWVAYNAKTGDLMDVDILNFDISKMIYKMPVALTAIKPGDILMHGGKPVFVREVATSGNTVRVIDYTNATVADILPVKSPFGFNFFTKVCPLFNFDQASASSDNPFGNMLPFLMLNGEKDGNFDPTLLFIASAMNGGNMDFASNPLMLYCLMNRQDKSDILPFVMMMNGGLFGVPSSNVTPKETKEVPASTNIMTKTSI